MPSSTGLNEHVTVAAQVRNEPIPFPATTSWSDEVLADQIRDALVHVHDIPRLQVHPLAARAAGAATSTRGRALQNTFFEAIASVRAQGRGHPADGTIGELLHLRYDEGLSVDDVARRLSISRAAYYRRHDRALAALVARLREVWETDGSRLVATQPAPPSVLPLAAPRLPRALTSFVGRERELREIAELLATAPLVTLAGAGGCGKTRLAYEVAARVADRYPDGVWLVELSDLTDPDLVPARVVTALGLNDRPGMTPAQRLADFLQERRCLLVLDNCEHLLQACATLVDALLRACQSLQVLATSRESLATDGEVIWRIPSLSLPSGETAPMAALVQSEAVQLFVARAQAVAPGFSLTDANGAAVADICRRLDGIPLAIELAAARVRALSPGEIASRLSDRFTLLTRGDAVSLPRHRTLRGLVDWSYELLTDPERQLFARLAVFPGSWDIAATEAIGGETGEPDGAGAAVLALLSALVDKSLVVAETEGQAARYRFLDTLRVYAQERLEASGELELIAERHAACFLDLAERAAPLLRGPDQGVWIDRLERELPNLRAALDWLTAHADAARALRMGAALSWFWNQRSHSREGYTRLSRALALRTAAAPARARALCGAGLLATNLGLQDDALPILEDGLASFREQGDLAGEAETLNVLGIAHGLRGDVAAADLCFGQALAISHSLGDRWAIGRAHLNLGEIAAGRADWTAARALLGRAMEEFRAVRAPMAIAVTASQLARVAVAESAPEEARRLYRESLSTYREYGLRYRIVEQIRGLASLEAADGNTAEAVALLDEARRSAHEIGELESVPEITQDLTALTTRASAKE